MLTENASLSILWWTFRDKKHVRTETTETATIEKKRKTSMRINWMSILISLWSCKKWKRINSEFDYRWLKTCEIRNKWKTAQLIIETLKGNQNVSEMNIRAENKFFQSRNSYWMHLLTRIVNNNGRYCLMSVLSLYFYFWYIIVDFTKKNEFFLPKSDRLIHLLISIVNNKCKYSWLCFPLIEVSFSQRKLIRQKKRNFIYPAMPVHWFCSWNLFITIWKIILREWIVIEQWFQSTPWKKREEKNFQARIYRKKDFFHKFFYNNWTDCTNLT